MTTEHKSPPIISPLAILTMVIVILSTGLILSDTTTRVWWQVLTLGVVEGITEFLPISSTAHLLIVSHMLGFEHSMGGTFEIVIQLGAVAAVVLYYARDLMSQVQALPTQRSTQRFWLGILLAFLPAALIGFFLRGWIKAVLFDSPILIASTLIIGGIALIAIERLMQQSNSIQQLDRVTPRHAFGIGMAQVFALVPGVSRSAASIMGGLVVGLDRPTATAFSFYLAIPTLGAATLVDLLSSFDQMTMNEIGYLVVGTLVSFLIAWLSIRWLLQYVAQHSFWAFGSYRVVAGILLLVLVGIGRF